MDQGLCSSSPATARPSEVGTRGFGEHHEDAPTPDGCDLAAYTLVTDPRDGCTDNNEVQDAALTPDCPMSQDQDREIFLLDALGLPLVHGWPADLLLDATLLDATFDDSDL